MKIPYGELQTVSITAKDDEGKPHTLEKIHYAFVIPCRNCKHYTDDEMEYYHYCNYLCWQVNSNDFCAWGEKKES